MADVAVNWASGAAPTTVVSPANVTPVTGIGSTPGTALAALVAPDSSSNGQCAIGATYPAVAVMRSMAV